MTVGLNPSNVPEKLTLEKPSKDANKFFNEKGDLVGVIYHSPSHDTDMYVSFRNKEKHFHRKHNSFAIDTSIIKTLVEKYPSVDQIAIFVIDKGNILLFDVDTYANAKEDFFGYGHQLFPEQTEAHTVYTKIFDFNKWYPETIEIED